MTGRVVLVGPGARVPREDLRQADLVGRRLADGRVDVVKDRHGVAGPVSRERWDLLVRGVRS